MAPCSRPGMWETPGHANALREFLTGSMARRNRDYHVIQSASQDGHNGNCQDKSREGQQHVADTHDDGINDAAVVSG